MKQLLEFTARCYQDYGEIKTGQYVHVLGPLIASKQGEAYIVKRLSDGNVIASFSHDTADWFWDFFEVPKNNYDPKSFFPEKKEDFEKSDRTTFTLSHYILTPYGVETTSQYDSDQATLTIPSLGRSENSTIEIPVSECQVINDMLDPYEQYQTNPLPWHDIALYDYVNYNGKASDFYSVLLDKLSHKDWLQMKPYKLSPIIVTSLMLYNNGFRWVENKKESNEFVSDYKGAKVKFHFLEPKGMWVYYNQDDDLLIKVRFPIPNNKDMNRGVIDAHYKGENVHYKYEGVLILNILQSVMRLVHAPLIIKKDSVEILSNAINNNS